MDRSVEWFQNPFFPSFEVLWSSVSHAFDVKRAICLSSVFCVSSGSSSRHSLGGAIYLIYWAGFGCFSDLKRPKEATIEAVLVKERKQYAVAVSLSRCSSERGLLELVLSGHTVAWLASPLARSLSLFRGLKALLCLSSESLFLSSSILPGFALLLSVDSSGFVIPVLFLCIAFGFLVDWFDLKRKKEK